MVMISGILMDPSHIFCGGLDFTLATSEFWGNCAKVDDLSEFFNQMFLDHELVDIVHLKLSPTWRNGRLGDKGIGKRLDRFLVDEHLSENLGKFKSWVVPSKISDHCPILFQFEVEKRRTRYPFKN